MTEECLSILELLDLGKANADDFASERNHVDGCPRCRALMSTLPDITVAGSGVVSRPKLTTNSSLQADAGPVEIGQLWRARAPEVVDHRYVVAVLGFSKALKDTIVVAPTSARLDSATHLDLFVEGPVLPYPMLVSPWNFGVIFAGQLEEYVGRLESEQTKDLSALYRSILTAAPAHLTNRVGPESSGPDDDRLLWREEQLEKLRPLWLPVRQALAHLADEKEARPSSPESESPSLSMRLGSAIDSEGHDVVSLAEMAHVSIEEVESVMSDKLDLTDQSDVDAVAAIIKVLTLDLDDIELPLRQTLTRQTGGLRVSNVDTDRIAARSHRDVSADQQRRNRTEGLTRLDTSPAARRQAIENYVHAVADRLG